MLKNIQKQLNLVYLNNDQHTHIGRSKGSTGLLDMAFISPNLAKHDIRFQIGETWAGTTYPSKSQLMLHYVGIHLLTTPSTNLTRLTEKCSNQHSKHC